jgi:hypothetical protein
VVDGRGGANDKPEVGVQDSNRLECKTQRVC